ncbi:hypothetical protein GQ53DRAFT_654175 [Thozetella sp. PMI_491]|nr:hypothetical protein GQ53DRAFT_654175 [Thozetella sp. PMI_491]
MAEPVSWFPHGESDSPGWRFDVITLLAVIGESSVADHSQAITASFLCMLPRIIPAPQAMLRATRPPRMPEVTAKMAGVYSGVVLDSVGFFANIIHPLDDMRPFAFRIIEIKHKDLNEAAGGVSASGVPASPSSHLFRRSQSGPRQLHGKLPRAPAEGEDSNEKAASSNGATRASTMASGLSGIIDPDPEQAGSPGVGIRRRLTLKETLTDILANPTLHNNKQRPAVPPKFWSPVHILSIFSTLLSLALIIVAGVMKDGTAMVAVAIISFASSIVGYASWWRPVLSIRSHTNKVPKGDIMIRTREGAFVLVRCTEDVARELYAGTEECVYYVGDRYYRALMGLGTVMIMVAVVLLGNTNWNMQVFVGASYIVLNGLYWGMGLLPREFFWDLGRYEWTDVTPEDAKFADESRDPGDVHRGVKSYTRTLWYAIRDSKRSGWVRRSGAAANTKQWDQWMAEAEREARLGNRDWNAVARKDAIMLDEDADGVDESVQHAPAEEVQPQGAAQVQASTF